MSLLIVLSFIFAFKMENVFSESERNKTHLKKFLLQNSNPSKKLGMIVKKYKLDDENTVYSAESLEEIKSRLEGLKTYILTKNKTVYLIPALDMFLNHISYKINAAKNNTEGTASLLSMDSVKQQILKGKQRFSIDLIKNKNQSIENANKLRKEIFNLIDYNQKKPEFSAHVTKQIDCADYTIERIVLTVDTRLTISGYLMIPKNVSFPAPVILALHQHGGEYYVGAAGTVGLTDCYPTMSYGPRLARKGYVVFAVDAKGFGARMKVEEDGEGAEDYMARWIGKSMFSMIIEDDLTALDYLVKRKEVNANRIGIIGHSMGGARATYLAALDKRIKAAVISGYITNYKEMIKRGQIDLPPSTWLPGILKYADCQDVLSLIAPRSLLVIHGKEDDVFPFEEASKVFTSVKRIYSLFKAEDNLKAVFFDGSHDLLDEAMDEAIKWFDKWLK